MILCMCLGVLNGVKAQGYTLEQLEQLFLKNNYQLIAARYHINKADAQIVQEKLWHNPTLSIDEVNLWSNSTSERYPPMIGRYGETQQLSIALEQLIETAGKRRKRISIKHLERKMAVYEFEEIMRDLKKELRQAYYQIAFQKESATQLQQLIKLFETLAERYANQLQTRNVSVSDHQRIQVELFAVQKEWLELQEDMHSNLLTLSALTQVERLDHDQILTSDLLQDRTDRLPSNLSAVLLEENLAIKRQDLVIKTANEQVALQKAIARPDLAVQISYDRGGNIMQDFVGIGVQIDLPVHNRNQGAIQAAKHAHEIAEVNRRGVETELQLRVSRLHNQLLNYQKMLKEWNSVSGDEIDSTLENYEKYLLDKQLSLLEFIDFVQASHQAKQALLELRAGYNDAFEELQYLLGKDF
ncbi:MAG: TolC family protein [Sphingobacterium sp.]